MLRKDYEDWLCHQRGLSRDSAKNNLTVFDTFTRFQFDGEPIQFDDVTPQDIVSFLASKKTDGWSYPDRSTSSRLRNLFRFLHSSDRLQVNLAESIPRTVARRPTAPRVRLDLQQIQHVVDSLRGESALARRNYAMLLLTARLGLRAQEVVAIRLEDIRWRTGEIVIRGKGRRHDSMPLPVDVGEALVDYIKNARMVSSRHLFVTVRAPWRRFRTGGVVNLVLENALEKAGCKPVGQRCGVHLFRHSLATTMLRQGASFDEIGDVLRHGRRTTTMIYARYDMDALRSIAQQ